MSDARIRELIEQASPFAGMQYFRGAPVTESTELARIRALPRRVLNVADPAAAVWWTQALRRRRPGTAARPACTCDGIDCRRKQCLCWQRYNGEPCLMHLRPVQGWALNEAATHRAFVGSIGVGKGKTGIDILTPMVIPGVKRAGVLLPAKLREQFLYDWQRWAEHFETPNLAGSGSEFALDGRPVTHVVPYSTLSQTQNTDLLTRLGLDLIIADEAQSLKDPKTARTSRFIADFNRFDPITKQRLPRPLYCAHSGTFTTTSPQDFAHHTALALGDGSPLPLSKPVIDEFCSALGELPQGNAAPGALLTMASEEELRELYAAHGDATTVARMVYAKRFRETPGVIVTIDGRPRHPETQQEINLVISTRKVAMPDAELNVPALVPSLRGKTLAQIARHTEDTWERPDGEELIEIFDYYRCLRELSAGFFYRWRFPRGEPDAVIDAWFAARKAWHKDVRDFLENPAPFADSPAWATAAAQRWHYGYEHVTRDAAGNETRQWIPPHTARGPMPVLASAAFLRWQQVEPTVEPVPSVVWLSDFLLDDALAWLRSNVGIVWYEHTAFGEELNLRARRAGLNVGFYPGGEEANKALKFEDGSRSIIASIEAHGTGKNLQKFGRGLISNPPGDGAKWEQLLGRWHRDGQMRHEVYAEVYDHTEHYRNSLDKAVSKARYIQTLMGSEQRLCYAEFK